MKKFWFSLLLLGFSLSLFSQVKFNLSYQAETQVYTVSVLPESTYPEPKNMVGSAQVVLRAAYKENFTPLITSLVDGVVWADNSYVDYPADAPEHTFVCIAMANGPSKKIALTSGQEVALFSFKNAGGDCPGPIELVSNDDPLIQTVRAAKYNVTQHFGVLGAKGNAYNGTVNGLVECALSTATSTVKDKMVESVQVSPVPADKIVTVRWQNLNDISQRTELVVVNGRSREVFREKVGGSKGENAVNIDVSTWPSGVYFFRFQFERGYQTRGWHFMVTR